MDSTRFQIIAGVVSSLIFIVSNIFMLLKAVRTKDLKSYSLGYLAFANLGNLVYWAYVISLPFGPIWFLHGFYTVVSGLMLLWFFRYKLRTITKAEGKPENTVQMCECMREDGISAISPISFSPFIWPAEVPAKNSEIPGMLPLKNQP